MQTTRLLLLCFVALIVVMGCSSEKTASTENADTQQAPEAEVQEINLAVSGMTWGACVTKVQAALSEIAGVTVLDVSLPDKAVVKIETGKVTTDDLTAAVTGAGFSATVQN